jgi:hypothetical protein
MFQIGVIMYKDTGGSHFLTCIIIQESLQFHDQGSNPNIII